MKIRIIEKTEDRLWLDLRPVGWVYLLAGGIFLVMGVATLALMGVKSVITVEGGYLKYEEVRVFSRGESFALPHHAVDEVVFGPVAENENKYRFRVVAGGEEYFIRLVSADGARKEALAAEILSALATPGGTMSHVDDARLAGWILGGLCILGGLLCVAVIQGSEVRADAKGVTIRRRLRFVPLGDERELLWEDFRNIVSEKVAIRRGVDPQHPEGVAAESASYRVVLLSGKGGRFPLSYGPMFTAKSAEEVMDLLRNAPGGFGKSTPRK